MDATPFLLRSAGVKTYLYYWVKSLMKLAGERELRLFPFLEFPPECVHDRSVLPYVPTMARLALLHAANYSGLPILDVLPRGEIFHASHQLRNPPRNTRLTATVYDMTCWLAPETHSAANVQAARRFADLVMKRADALIAISENSRQDAIRILDLDPAKVHTIYPGVASAFFEAKPRPAPKPYILFVGTIEPRKNVPALLDAWEQVPDALREAYDLVLAGSPGWGQGTGLERLQAGIRGVRYLGYVTEAEMPGLTAGAAAMVYPSLYEGFGLPVAQAMAAGVPVVTSHGSSLSEISEGAAVLVDPRSASEIARGIEKLLSDSDLRAALGHGAREKAAEYRWERCAEQSWRLFEGLVG